ncbi:MAG: metallophosphoesterase family protein [Cypionkella sp.]|nr:metallophosphoesterase family protein [Cypionkella sp.]
MRCAILTDIHANREAFDAALSSAAARGVDQWVLLGDMVGFGPDPDYVLDKIEAMVAKGAVALRGNHDRHLPTPAKTLNPAARRVIDWTVNKLNARQKLFLGERPLTYRLGDALFVHASAHHPQDWNYINSAADARACFAATDARITLCGHGHVPRLFALKDQVLPQDIAPDLAVTLDRPRRWVGVVGSVGMPRGARAVAHYCILDSAANTLSYHECPYDAGVTAQKIRATGMPLARHLGLLRLG